MAAQETSRDSLVRAALTLRGNHRKASLFISGNRGGAFRNNKLYDLGRHASGSGDFDPNGITAGVYATGNRDFKYENNLLDHGNGDGLATGKWTRPGGSFNGARGFWIGNWWDSVLEHNPTITGNVVRKAAHTGIAMHPSGGYIAKNYFDGNGCAGAKVTPNAGGPEVVIEDNVTKNSICQGFQIEQVMPGSGGITVRRNQSSGNGQAFLYSGEGVLNGVRVLDNVSTGEKAYGGITFHGGNNIEIRGNRIADQGGTVPEGLLQQRQGHLQRI